MTHKKPESPANAATPKIRSPALSLEERMRVRATKMPIKKAKPALAKVIEVFNVLIDERQRGRSSDDLAKLLASEGVNITAGAIRNYLALIARAVVALESVGKSTPHNEEIHKMVNKIAKAARKSGNTDQQSLNLTDAGVRQAGTATPKIIQHTTSLPTETSLMACMRYAAQIPP